MEKYLQSLGYNVDVIDKTKNHKSLSSFDLVENTIVYFDLLGDYYLSEVYDNKPIEVKNEMSKHGNEDVLRIYYLPKITFQEIDLEVLKYFLPHLNYDFITNQFSNNNSIYLNQNKSLLECIGYNGNVKSGVIIVKRHNIYIVEHTNINYLSGQLDPKEFILKDFQAEVLLSFESPENNYFSRQEFVNKIEESLDDETRQKIDKINAQIEEFKNSGVLMHILPLLKQTLKKYETEIDLDSISIIQVDNEYNVILPYFNNMIVPLSHLTKAIYILFTRYPEGIDIKKLYNYKNELRNLYFEISHQENLDKMEQTISDLVELNSNVIYTHISRIKSAFYNLMDKFYADNYIVTSDYGSQIKSIPILLKKEVDEDISDEDISDIVNSIF